MHAGAKNVVVVDPLEFKRETALQFGATHAFASAAEAQAAVVEMTRGQGADEALVTVGVVDEDVISAAFDVVGKGGVVVVTGLANPAKLTVHVSGGVLTLFEKTIKGSLFGSGNPQRDILKMLDLYQAGHAQARRAGHRAVHAGPGQPGLRRPGGGQEHPGRGRPRRLTGVGVSARSAGTAIGPVRGANAS